MMMGMPIIATNVGGIPSLIKDNHEGILVQDGDPYALASAIIEMMKNRDLAYKFGMNARVKACQRHNKEKIMNDLLEIYREIKR